MLSFQKCRVAISGENIMAESASINESNSLTPVAGLGFRGPHKTSPSGPIKNNISLSYILETSKEPNFGALQNIRNYNSNSFPIQVIVGNLTGSCYLTNYSLSIQPHNVIKVNSSYDIYTPITGISTNQNNLSDTFINVTNVSTSNDPNWFYYSFDSIPGETYVMYAKVGIFDPVWLVYDTVIAVSSRTTFAYPIPDYSAFRASWNPHLYDRYNLTNASGIGHYWSTIIKSNDSSTTGSVSQLNYSFSLNWQPVYRVGDSYPVEVKFLGGTEEFSFVSEYEKRINVTGLDFKSQFTDFDIIQINPISLTWGTGTTPLTLFPNSGKIVSNNINIQEDNVIVQETLIQKFY